MRIDVNLDHRDMDDELARLQARQCREVGTRSAPTVFATHEAGFTFSCKEVDGEFHVQVEDRARGALAGCTVFQRVPEVSRQTGRPMRSPHSRYATPYRRRGLATVVYRWALDSGLCLVSGPRQSPAAFGLWQSLAASYAHAFVQVGEKGLRIISPAEAAARLGELDTRMLLLGCGWTARRLAMLAVTAPA